MGIVTVSLDDEAEKRLRVLAEAEGGKKGDMGKVLSGAINKTYDEARQKAVAERIRERMSKGLYKLPKNWKFKRDKLYDRK